MKANREIIAFVPAVMYSTPLGSNPAAFCTGIASITRNGGSVVLQVYQLLLLALLR
jgi:hypothetical protein